jgi:CRP-like cAMP-binding protein
LNDQSIDPGILRKIPIFSSLSEKEILQILSAPENGIEEFGMKKTIVKESEVGDCMYVVLDGAVEVFIRGGGHGRELPIATLRAGDFFGEQAIISSGRTARRNATVRSLHSAKVFRIDKKYVNVGVKSDMKDSEDVTTVPLPTNKDLELRKLIKGMRLFKSLKDNELASIGTWTEIKNVPPGEFVVKESEKADCLYVVLEGKVEIFTLDDDGKVIILAIHEPGTYFGEQALLPGSDGKRTAYARSKDKAKLIRIPKAYFRLILNRDAELAEALQKIGQKQKQQRDQLHKH